MRFNYTHVSDSASDGQGELILRQGGDGKFPPLLCVSVLYYISVTAYERGASNVKNESMSSASAAE